MTEFGPTLSSSPKAAWYVMAAGVVAALYVGKLPPALPVLGKVLGVTLLQAGFLLSLVQLAGMLLGLVTGLAVQRAGLKRSMVAGLLVLCGAGLLGGMSPDVHWLLAARVFEGLGFLWVVLPAPAMIRQLVPQQRLNGMLGIWGAYMPLGASLALLGGPAIVGLAAPDWGWRVLWWFLAVLAAGLALLVAWQVPAQGHLHDGISSRQSLAPPSRGRDLVRATLRSRAAWYMAVAFAMYSGQWLAVVGFLPSIYTQAGVSGVWVAWLTALAAAVNIIGNVAAGRLLGRGVQPVVLLGAGFLSMAGGAQLAFAVHLSPEIQYVAILVFSMVGGLIPATLFNLAIRLAPRRDAVSTTIGWIQQWSALGQFAGPPLAAWVASTAGGWQWTGWLATASSAIALVLATLLHRLPRPADQST